jgi:hypothetical protein
LLIKAKKTSDDYQQLKKLREAGEFKWCKKYAQDPFHGILWV